MIYGDEAKGKAQQTIWVADVQAELGGPMKVKVAPPPPPAPILPEKDAAAETPPVKFLDAVAGQKMPLVPPREAATRVSVMEAAYRAARERTWVKPA